MITSSKFKVTAYTNISSIAYITKYEAGYYPISGFAYKNGSPEVCYIDQWTPSYGKITFRVQAQNANYSNVFVYIEWIKLSS
jgi:hypothetical protein